MGALWGRILLGLIFAVVIAIAFQVVTVLLFGRPSNTWPIQTLTNPRSAFIDEATRTELLIPSLLRLSRPMILIVGASSAQEAYLPNLVEKRAPGYDEHNLGMAAANMTEVDQELRQIVDAAPAQWLSRSILLICVNYANFAPDNVRWRNPLVVPPRESFAPTVRTDLARSEDRCLFGCGNLGFASKVLPSRFGQLWATHYLVYQELTQHLPIIAQGTLPFARIWSTDPRRLLNHRRADAVTLIPATESGKRTEDQRQLNFLNSIMGNPSGSVSAEQFNVLLDTINFARSKRLRVVIVDMPLTSWHRQTSPFFKPYEIRLRATLKPLLRKHMVDVINLADALPDYTFRDTSHPLASKAAMWTDVLFERLRPIINSDIKR
jgi:hypothetical protein